MQTCSSKSSASIVLMKTNFEEFWFLYIILKKMKKNNKTFAAEDILSYDV